MANFLMKFLETITFIIFFVLFTFIFLAFAKIIYDGML